MKRLPINPKLPRNFSFGSMDGSIERWEVFFWKKEDEMIKFFKQKNGNGTKNGRFVNFLFHYHGNENDRKGVLMKISEQL